MKAKDCAYLVANCKGESVNLVNQPANVAAYIAAHNGSSMNIRAPDKTLLMSTYGFFTDRCTDMDLYSTVMKELKPIHERIAEPQPIEIYNSTALGSGRKL